VIDDPYERLRRVGHNEALFRQVNEQVEEVNDAFSNLTNAFAIVCECGDSGCIEQIKVPPAMYERTREDSTHFIVKPGHQAEDVEDVIETQDDYVIVEKSPPAAREIAEETDARN
jgi:hypothetical protein